MTEEFGCPGVTFRSWQDIKIQLLTIVFIDTLFADLKKEWKRKEKRISWYVKNKNKIKSCWCQWKLCIIKKRLFHLIWNIPECNPCLWWPYQPQSTHTVHLKTQMYRNNHVIVQISYSDLQTSNACTKTLIGNGGSSESYKKL